MNLFRHIWKTAAICITFTLIEYLCMSSDIPHAFAMTIGITVGFVALVMLTLVWDEWCAEREDEEDLEEHE